MSYSSAKTPFTWGKKRSSDYAADIRKYADKINDKAVAAIVNVPHELPGTSSTAPAGSVIVHFASGASGCWVDVGTLRTNDSGRVVFAPDG